MDALVGRGYGKPKSKARGAHLGSTDQDFGPMVREISPVIMFWESDQKWEQMGAGRYISVRMSAIGSTVSMRRKKKKVKRKVNAWGGRIFQYMTQ